MRAASPVSCVEYAPSGGRPHAIPTTQGRMTGATRFTPTDFYSRYSHELIVDCPSYILCRTLIGVGDRRGTLYPAGWRWPMEDRKATQQSGDEPLCEERWTRKEAERRMREVLDSLPPPPPIEELARRQGVRPPQSLDDLPRWPEDDLEAWEGFDEFLEELRHGKGDLGRWARNVVPGDH